MKSLEDNRERGNKEREKKKLDSEKIGKSCWAWYFASMSRFLI